jgi:hypothetical protein
MTLPGFYPGDYPGAYPGADVVTVVAPAMSGRSLASKLAPLARRLITPEGLALAFSRVVPGEYDALSNTEAEPTTTTWTAVGMWVANDSRNEPTQAVPTGTGRRVTRKTLLVPGLGFTPPEPGDTVVAGGVTYTVGDVERVADTDGVTVPLWRVQVAA